MQFIEPRLPRRLVFIFIVFSCLLFPLAAGAHQAGFSEKTWALQTVPTLDGTVSAGEWTDTARVLVAGYTSQSQVLELNFKQDGTNLYLALSKPSLGGNNNRVSLFFDANHNAVLDAPDRGVQLVYNAAGINTTSYYTGAGGAWTSGALPAGWSFYRQAGNGSAGLEVKLPLADIGLTADGSIAGFMAMTCDRTTASERVGWPDFFEDGTGSCNNLPLVPNATVLTSWGNLVRTTSAYPGVASTQSAWTNFTFGNYTYHNALIRDWESSADPSNGGTAVQPADIDIASDTPAASPGSSTSVQFAFYNGGTQAGAACDAARKDDQAAFRLWTDGDPHFKTGYGSRHWNVLVDLDADGYKEFWLDLFGGYSQNGPDLLYLYYEDIPQQDLLDPAAALKFAFPADSISGSTTSFVRYGPVARGGEGSGVDYYIDMQVPLRYFDLADNGVEDCSLSSATPLGLFDSTSASNTNPLQKDWMMDPNGQAIGWTPDQTVTFGDTITIDPDGTGGSFTLAPLAYQESAGPDTVLSFAHLVANRDSAAHNFTFTSSTTGTCGPVAFYVDSNGNGLRDSGENTAVASPTSLGAGSALNFVVEAAAGSSGSCQIDISVSDGVFTKQAADAYSIDSRETGPRINEIMVDPASGSEWLEITNPSSFNQAGLSGWVISDGDGNTYTFPGGLGPMPAAASCGGDEARLLVVFGTGVDETDWGDCLATVYTGSSGWFSNPADDVSLCSGSCGGATLVDYLAYGANPGVGDDAAVSAGLWAEQTYAAAPNTGWSLARLQAPGAHDGYDTNSYTDWYPANDPTPGEKNKPAVVINEVEISGAAVTWAELYILEDGIAGAGVEISGWMLTDLNGSDTALSGSPVTVASGEYVRVEWNAAGVDETDAACSAGGCGAYRDLYLADTAPNSSGDNQLVLASAAAGGVYLDALAWDHGGGGGTGAALLNAYTLNGVPVPQWAGAGPLTAVAKTAFTGSTMGRDALSLDAGAAGDWDDTGGSDALDETPGARNVGLILNEILPNPASGQPWVELFCGSAIDFSATPYLVSYAGGFASPTGACASGAYLRLDTPGLRAAVDSVSLCQGGGCDSSSIRDFLAYGGDPGETAAVAVSAGIWTPGDYLPTATLKTGESLGRDSSQADTNRSTDWDAHGGRDAVGPTPAAQNTGQVVLINEILFNPQPGAYPWIELYNPSAQPVDLYGYTLVNSSGDSAAILADADPSDPDVDHLYFPAHSYLTVVLDDGGASGSDDTAWDDGSPAELHVNFSAGADSASLGSSGTLSLCAAACSAAAIRDFFAWGGDPGAADDTAVTAGMWSSGDYLPTPAVSAGESLGRDQHSSDLDAAMDWSDHGGPNAVGITYGQANTGSVVLNEIGYQGSSGDWVELVNPTSRPLDLDGFSLSLDGGASGYTFPAGLERIPAGGYLILWFTAGADDLAWSDGDLAVLHAGAVYAGLGDSSGSLAVYRSGAMSPASLVDFAAYGADAGAADDQAAAAGLWTEGAYIVYAPVPGDTLGRDRSSADTNTPSDWADTGGPDAAQPTPGQYNYTTPFAPAPTALRLVNLAAHSQLPPAWPAVAGLLTVLLGAILLLRRK